MSRSDAFRRAQVWLGQGRPDRAEPELREALAVNPQDGYAHGLLALCLSDLDRKPEALEAARDAVRTLPDAAFAHYAMAVVQANRGYLEEARAAAVESIRLDPEDPDVWSLKGQIELSDRRWSDALEAADRGLALRGDHVASANVRAMALRQLGRADEADATMRQVLAWDPEDASSHVNEGWRLLHQREVDKAAEHFREALRLEPGNEAARSGMIEAIKANNRLYRMMLRFFMWMGTLSRKTVWLVLILLWLAPRFLRNVARDHPELEPILIPLAVAIVGFVYLTWIIEPLFDLMLFWHPLGRHALNRAERLRAMAVTACLGGALLGGLIGFAWTPALLIGILLLTFVIPLSAALGVEEPAARRRLALGLLGVLGVVAIGILATGPFALTAEPGSWAVVTGGLVLTYLAGSLILALLANRWAMSTRTD